MPQPISVVICTRTRPETIDRCLESVLRVDYSAFEIVIVDNTDAGNLTSAHAADERVRVVREIRPGLSRARNTGVRSARHDILAFVDDDVVVDPGWLRAIATALEDETIAAVTGLVVPAELETEAQREFEWYGGMGKGTEQRLFGGATMSARQAIGVQEMGVGANMAFRRMVFERLGGFDEALGPGASTLGADDLDFFHRALCAGFIFRYEPAARVSHRHRRTVGELRAQIFANGCSYGVYLMKIWNRRSVRRHETALFAVSWVAERLGTALYRSIARPGLRRRLAWDEVRGAASALGVYRRAYQAT